jgi:hypothetical protein
LRGFQRKEQFIEEENKGFEEMLASSVKDCSRAGSASSTSAAPALPLLTGSRAAQFPFPLFRKFLR